MKTFTLIFFTTLFLFLFSLLNTQSPVQQQLTPEQAREKANTYKLNFAFSCRPDLAGIDFDDPNNSIPLLQGWGSYRMPVTVTNDSAAIYFQQGINMYYGFHIIEALASFEKSVQFDSSFAMGYWGKALAYGPNINDIGYAASPDALAALAKAQQLSTQCTDVEKALINAMALRYSVDSTQTRESLNQRYADAMKEVHTQYPKSADAAALYADALMVQHPWDLYDNHYQPKPWTPAIVKVLEGLTKQFPTHPGANHYYIHAIEGSAHPEVGMAVANRLGAMMPGVAHLVHMPSHIYIRSGYYNQGVVANAASVNAYENYLSKYPVVQDAAFLYLVHNLHMQTACANMDARYKESLQLARQASASFDSSLMNDRGYFGMYLQYVNMAPVITQIRFGKWNDILNAQVPESRVYAKAILDFAQGLAYARQHETGKAKQALNHLKDSASSTQLNESPPTFNPGITAVNLASKVLEGIIAEEENDLTLAVSSLTEAVRIEDTMFYNEPKDWLLPARQYLGNVLLKAQQYQQAENVYKQDLLVNPNNAWSLTGLKQSLIKQNKSKEAAQVEKKIIKALQRSDTQLTASVF